MLVLRYDYFTRFATSGGNVLGVFIHSSNFVEDGIFGRFPIVGPAKHARGGKRFGTDKLHGVMKHHAIAIEIKDGFEAGEEYGEDFELEMFNVMSIFFPQVVLDDETFCIQGGKDLLADFGFVFVLRGYEDVHREGFVDFAEHADADEGGGHVGTSAYDDDAGFGEERGRLIF